jgi:hypothetical protein
LRFFIRRATFAPSTNTNTMKTQLFTGSLSVPTVISDPIYASVRIKKNTNKIRDGRIYKSEKSMRRNACTRPENVTFIKIFKRLNYGLLEVEIIN